MDVIDVLNDGSDLSDDFLVAFCGSEQDAEGAKNLLTKLKESKVGLGVSALLALKNQARVWNSVGKQGFEILKKNKFLAELLNDLNINVPITDHIGDIFVGGSFLKKKLSGFLGGTTNGGASVGAAMPEMTFDPFADMEGFMENALQIDVLSPEDIDMPEIDGDVFTDILS